MATKTIRPLGIEGELVNFPFPDLSEVIYKADGIEITVSSGLLSVGFSYPDQEENAKEAALLWLAAWNLRQGWDAKVEFNRSWEIAPNGAKRCFMAVGGETKAKSRETVTISWKATIAGKARIITQQIIDTASFSNDRTIVEKANNHHELKEALHHYHNEVAPNDRPLYGIYKALECLTKKIGLDGRKKLGKLAGKDFAYVDNVMETANAKRHASSSSRTLLSEKECRDRAKFLIEEYAASLPT